MNTVVLASLLLVASALATPVEVGAAVKRDVAQMRMPSWFPRFFPEFPAYIGYPGYSNMRVLFSGQPEGTYYEPAAKGYIYPHETGDIYPVIFNSAS